MASNSKCVPVTFIEPLRLRDAEFRARAGYAHATDAAWDKFRWRLTRTHGIKAIGGTFALKDVDRALMSERELVV